MRRFCCGQILDVVVVIDAVVEVIPFLWGLDVVEVVVESFIVV